MRYAGSPSTAARRSCVAAGCGRPDVPSVAEVDRFVRVVAEAKRGFVVLGLLPVVSAAVGTVQFGVLNLLVAAARALTDDDVAEALTRRTAPRWPTRPSPGRRARCGRSARCCLAAARPAPVPAAELSASASSADPHRSPSHPRPLVPRAGRALGLLACVTATGSARGRRSGSVTVPRLAFLGPHATFTEQALLTLPEAQGAELVPCAGNPAVLAAIRDGRADAGCVPIENSVEGAVPAGARTGCSTTRRW